MCLGVPMRIIESDGFTALCERLGERRRVNVMLIEEAPVGACVLVHVNNAVRLLDEEEASLINEALEELASALDRHASARSPITAFRTSPQDRLCVFTEAHLEQTELIHWRGFLSMRLLVRVRRTGAKRCQRHRWQILR